MMPRKPPLKDTSKSRVFEVIISLEVGFEKCVPTVCDVS